MWENNNPESFVTTQFVNSEETSDYINFKHLLEYFVPISNMLLLVMRQ